MRDSESQNKATSVAILQVEAGNEGAGVPLRDHPASRLPPPDTGPTRTRTHSRHNTYTQRS